MSEELQQQAEEATSTQPTTEEQLNELRKVSAMRHKVLSGLVGNYVDHFSSIMVSTNKVSFQKKLEAAKALREAIQFSLDYGLEISKANIRQEGSPLAKEVNGLAGVMVQALDTRFLLLADKIKQQEDQANNEQAQTNSTEEVTNG